MVVIRSAGLYHAKPYSHSAQNHNSSRAPLLPSYPPPFSLPLFFSPPSSPPPTPPHLNTATHCQTNNGPMDEEEYIRNMNNLSSPIDEAKYIQCMEDSPSLVNEVYYMFLMNNSPSPTEDEVNYIFFMNNSPSPSPVVANTGSTSPIPPHQPIDKEEYLQKMHGFLSPECSNKFMISDLDEAGYIQQMNDCPELPVQTHQTPNMLCFSSPSPVPPSESKQVQPNLI